MKLSIKDMDIATGGPLIAILNEKDAESFDLHTADRIHVTKGSRSIIAVVDFAESDKAVPCGKIGLFEEVLDALNLKDGDIIKISLAEKPESVYLIKKKLDGAELKPKEINQIMKDLVDGKLITAELTYYVAANYMKGMSFRETIALTKSMINTGIVLKIKKHKIIADKHCIGGVAGNRTTMIIVPILAAAGVCMPKTSSRSITSPAGTADTMEVLCNVILPIKEIKRVVEKVGGCIVWGGAVHLAPADDAIINVENPLSIDAEGQLLASIMAKKGSVSATHVLIDIPYGPDAKLRTLKEAKHLKGQFEKIAKGLNMKVLVLITDGSQPIGNGIGPGLEARDALWILKDDPKQPYDLTKKSVKLAGALLELCGKAKKGKGEMLAKEMLISKKAYAKMLDIITEQGPKVFEPDEIKLGEHTYDYKAYRSGRISHISNVSLSKIARIAGCPKDQEAGIYLYKHKGDKVKKGDKVMTIYARNKLKLHYAKKMIAVFDGIVIK